MSNITSPSYHIQYLSGILNHARLRPRFVRDEAEFDLDLEAKVHSGDYFVTLATELDALNSRIEDRQIRGYLEDTISDLIYLQDNYTVTKQKRLQ